MRDAIADIYTRPAVGAPSSAAPSAAAGATPLLGVRLDFAEGCGGGGGGVGGGGGGGVGAAVSKECCEAVDLAMRLEGSAASLLLSSIAPAALWKECDSLRGGAPAAAGPLLPSDEPAGDAAAGGAAGPITRAPSYHGHRGEWFPEY